MNTQRKSLFAAFCLLVAFAAKTIAGDSVSFPAFNTGTITGGGAAVTQVLNVSGLPTNEYFFVSVTADFVPAAAPHGGYSSSMKMEINNGSSTVYWPLSTATNGVLPGAGSTTLTWRGVFSRTYVGGGNLSIKFQDPFTDASGPYSESLSNVIVTLYPAPAPKKSFPAFNTTTITGGGAAVTQALNVSGLPNTEYLLMMVTADFVPAAAPHGGFSSSMRMELNNGSSTVYWPLSLPTAGVLSGAGGTSLTWTGILPRSYVGGGNLSVKFQDPFTDGSGPYTETLSNVVVSLYPAPIPTKTFASFNTGTITGGGAAVTQALDVSSLPNTEYLLFSVTGDFVPAASPHGGYSSTMKMEINNGSSTVYWPLSTATTGVLPAAGGTTLTWRGMLPKSYIGGGNLSIKFQDTFTDASGPYTESLTNVTATIYPVYTAPPVITSPGGISTKYNVPITYTITATGSPTNFGASSLPLGLNVNTANGQITGTPINSGTFTATISATNLGGSGSATLVISIVPGIVSVVAPTNGNYTTGDNLDFTVKFSAPVTVSSGAGVPFIPLVVGSTVRRANYLSGSGKANLIFRYTVQSGETDADGISVSPVISPNGSTIRDAFGNNAVLTFPSLTTTGVLVNNTGPVITSAATANGTYGSAFVYTITTSESPVSFEVTGLPAGLGVDSSSGQITGTPTTIGIFSAVITATDLAGNFGKLTVTITISKASLSATADSKSRPFGVANPALTGSLTGVASGDNITAAFNTTATPASAPGTYPIVPSLNDPNGKLPNYNVTLVNGTLTIAPKPPLAITSTISRNGNFIFSGTNGYGTGLGNFYVRSSTDIATPFASWAYETTNSFDATGTFSVTNPINPGTPQKFYRLEQP